LKQDQLDGFAVPLTDEHLSQYVDGYAQRLAWLKGFESSAGSAVVLADRAAILTDGRYTLQVRAQVDGELFRYQAVPETSPAEWLKVHAPQGGRIGCDPWLHGRVGVAGEQGTRWWRRLVTLVHDDQCDLQRTPRSKCWSCSGLAYPSMMTGCVPAS